MFLQFVFEIGSFERVSAESFLDVAFHGRRFRLVTVVVYTRFKVDGRIRVLVDACPVTVFPNLSDMDKFTDSLTHEALLISLLIPGRCIHDNNAEQGDNCNAKTVVS